MPFVTSSPVIRWQFTYSANWGSNPWHQGWHSIIRTGWCHNFLYFPSCSWTISICLDTFHGDFGWRCQCCLLVCLPDSYYNWKMRRRDVAKRQRYRKSLSWTWPNYCQIYHDLEKREPSQKYSGDTMYSVSCCAGTFSYSRPDMFRPAVSSRIRAWLGWRRLLLLL